MMSSTLNNNNNNEYDISSKKTNNNHNHLVCSYLSEFISIDNNGSLFLKTYNKILKIHHHCPIISINCMNFDQILCLDKKGNVFNVNGSDFMKDKMNIYFQNNIPISPSEYIIPRYIKEVPIIKNISCGKIFSLLLSTTGNVYSFGSNEYGQLGLNDYINRKSPTMIKLLNNIEIIECGENFSICKSQKEGEECYCYAWGDNSYGQLDIGFIGNEPPITYPMKCNNTLQNIKSIKCGNDHSLFLTKDGNIFICGYSRLNDYRDPIRNAIRINNLPPIIKISCGYTHSMCIDNEHNLWVFGDNSIGQLGNKCSGENSDLIKIGNIKNIIDLSYKGDVTICRTSNGNIHKLGCDKYIHYGSSGHINTYEMNNGIYLKDFTYIWE